MKRDIPLIITFLTGFLCVIAFFIPHPPFGDLQQRFLVWYAIVAGFTMILGLDSLVKYNVKKITQHKPGWQYSYVLLFGLALVLVTGFQSWFKYNTPFELRSSFMYSYIHIIVPLQATMFALLAFFISSSAYRAFRARTFEATLLLIAAAIVMLGRVPIGEMISDKIPLRSDWLLNVPQLAAKRGIQVGVYLGGVVMSLRIILGIERTYLT
ncbi:hypothetical protein IBX73_01420 [candidate division WOR-3 bacterium]|nr:hypothetical protein [candidate division WOR-3 bacterium]